MVQGPNLIVGRTFLRSCGKEGAAEFKEEAKVFVQALPSWSDKTSHAHGGHGAHTTPLMEPTQVHLVLEPSIQVSHDDLPLLASDTHHLGPPITALVLDS